MIIWLDAQLAPSLAAWIQTTFNVQAEPLRGIGLRDATDTKIFETAKAAGAIIMIKDGDFVKLHDLYGAPPQIIWLTCGNTSNKRLRDVLVEALPKALKLLENGEGLVEIADRR